MRSIHIAGWIDAVGRPTAATFVALFALIGFVRALLITVVPLSAHALLGDAQTVSVLFFAVSVAGLLGSLAIPSLVHRIGRRYVFSTGITMAVLAAALMSIGTTGWFIAGMVANALSIAALEIALNLYIMDHIPRRELGRFEPLRVFFAAGMWTLGPWLGVWLHANVGPEAPFALAAAAAVLGLIYFFYLRLVDHPAVARARRPPPNPLKYLVRFYAQPRLRLAWALAIGRSAWWSMYFIYAPIHVVTSGLDPVWAGAIVSFGTASFFLVPLWSRMGRRYGLRRLLIAGYLATGVVTICVALSLGPLSVAALILAATMAGIIDAVGNVPFLRAVHPYERPEMLTVYNSFRGVSQTLPPGVFALLLRSFELSAVFLVGGAAMASLAWLCRFLPRRL
ncbi:MAG: MFS transporter [Rhodospirillales bacterium]|nr:MAG: MFS transporter [Rhodospirillales bacterium]